MKTIDIVKLFEKYIQRFNDKAVIVLRKNLEPCSFKAYKKLSYSLYFTNRATGNGFELVNMDSTARVTNEEEERILREILDANLVTWMFEYIRKSNLNYVNE